MNELIKEAVALMPKNEKLPQDHTAITKRLREIDRQIANLTSAVCAGEGQLRPLLEKMEALESDRLKVEMRAKELVAQVEVSRRKRPDVDQVCREWSRFMELWEEADTTERESIMQGMVKRVEMVTKEVGTCEVAIMPQVPFLNMELTYNQRAFLHEVTNYPDLYIRGFAVPRPSRKGARLHGTIS